MFLLESNIVNTLSARLTGQMAEAFEIDPLRQPEEYGLLITGQTVIPCIFSIPFFMWAGCAIWKEQKGVQTLGEQKEGKSML